MNTNNIWLDHKQLEVDMGLLKEIKNHGIQLNSKNEISALINFKKK
jgi:hypothetical protein